ncbi:MAG: GreA/GreB family elongation factor [Bacteroidota bacterium]
MAKEEIKEEILKKCKERINTQIHNIEKTIASNRKALESETKSSAGDKHETGRAMLQLEMEKASQQFASVNQMYQIINRISLEVNTEIISLGSVVKTSFQYYFLSVSIGEIKVDDQVYYAVSPKSPIGNLLLGKRVGDEVVFNGIKIEILEIF